VVLWGAPIRIRTSSGFCFETISQQCVVLCVVPFVDVGAGHE
jgi:hypothetical protein